MFWNLHVVVRKSPLKQPREHLLSHTKFSDSLNIICATFAQASYLTQLAWLEKICIGLSQLINELQKENILILKLIIKSFSKPFLCRWKTFDYRERRLLHVQLSLVTDGWGETTIPRTLPSTIKTTYLQSSIIKKGPNPPLPPYWNHLWVRRDHATWQNSAVVSKVCFLPLRTPQNQ